MMKRKHSNPNRFTPTRFTSILLVGALALTGAPLLADGSDKAERTRERYERDHKVRSSSKAERHDKKRGDRYDHNDHNHSRYDKRYDDRYHRERYRDRNHRDRHHRDRHYHDRSHRDRHYRSHRDRHYRDRHYRDRHYRDRHYRYHRNRHDRYRYDRHRHSHRYGHHGFSIPRRIVHDLLHLYTDYYHTRHYYADHGHYHTIYRFPVIVDGYASYRPYAYCEGELYASGYFTDDGFEFNFNYND